jgi:hypothetical protein
LNISSLLSWHDENSDTNNVKHNFFFEGNAKHNLVIEDVIILALVMERMHYIKMYILVLPYNCFDRSYAACVIELVIATVVMLSQQEDSVGNSEAVRGYNRVVTQLDIFAYNT